VTDTLVISDLHLSQGQPQLTRQFLRFISGPAADCRRLIILGDLFDAWLGDDDDSPPAPQVQQALKQLRSAGTQLMFMPGNRDFLLGNRFAGSCGIELLPDPSVLELGGEPTLLMHGDLLCTDDHDYQQARAMLRNPAAIADLLAKPLEVRRQIAADYRRRSGEATSTKPADIMDANPGEVERQMRSHGVRLLIHGHTHRPGDHRFTLDGQPARRLVLPAWDPQTGGGYLALAAAGWQAATFPA